MRVRCPDCDQLLEVDDSRGPAGTCPRCGERVTLPQRSGAPETGWRERDRNEGARRWSRDEDEDAPQNGRFDIALRPRAAARWPRFLSPSMMVLALLTLPLPWLEVSCQGSGTSTPRFHYTQTGAQMMADTQTDVTAPQAGSPPRGPRPFRQGGTIIWAVTLVGGAVAALAGRGLAWNIVSACCAAFAVIIYPLLMLGVIVSEATNSVTLTPWPMLAFLACCGALAGSIVTLVREWPASMRAPPPRYGDEDD